MPMLTASESFRSPVRPACPNSFTFVPLHRYSRELTPYRLFICFCASAAQPLLKPTFAPRPPNSPTLNFLLGFIPQKSVERSKVTSTDGATYFQFHLYVCPSSFDPALLCHALIAKRAPTIGLNCLPNAACMLYEFRSPKSTSPRVCWIPSGWICTYQ